MFSCHQGIHPCERVCCLLVLNLVSSTLSCNGAVEHLKAKLNGELSGQGIRVVGTPTIVAHDMSTSQLLRPLGQPNSVNDRDDFWGELFADHHLAPPFPYPATARLPIDRAAADRCCARIFAYVYACVCACFACCH